MSFIKSPLKIVNAKGNIGMASGSRGCFLMDLQSKDSLGFSAGSFYDCEIVNGRYFGVKIIPGNPATSVLLAFNNDLSDSSTILPPNKSFGQLASYGDQLYWQCGNLVNKYLVGPNSVLPQNQNDIGQAGRGIAANKHGYYVISLDKIYFFSHSHALLKSISISPARQIVCDDKYIALLGASLKSDASGRYLETVVLDAESLNQVSSIKQYGKFGSSVCVGKEKVIVCRPEYSNGSITGVLEIFEPNGNKVKDMAIDEMAHYMVIADDVLCATNVGPKIIDGIFEDVIVLEPVPELDPFDQFMLAYGQNIEPNVLNFMLMLQSFGLIKDYAGYVAFYNLLQG